MQAQFDNLVLSSFLLWINNKIATKGLAYTNVNCPFYPVPSNINGYYAYSNPYGQFISDISVPGAVVPTGVYLNSNFITTGVSGLKAINYERGNLYFSSPLPKTATLTGMFAVKELSINVVSEKDVTLLFESQTNIRPKIGQAIVSGLPLDTITYPSILIVTTDSINKPVAFGGLDETSLNISCYILANSQFQVDAVCSILRDLKYELVPLLSASEMPYNAFGHPKTGLFDYHQLHSEKIDNYSYLVVEDVNTSRYLRERYFSTNNINPECYVGTADFNLIKYRYPRQ